MVACEVSKTTCPNSQTKVGSATYNEHLES